jgi:hypothetical protein
VTAYEGVKRTGPPVAVQKLRESFYMVQVTLSEPPSADWKRLFYDTQGAGVPADFPPRSVEITGGLLKFRSEAAAVEPRIGWIDKWIDRANQKEASMGARMDDERRRRREEMSREHQELTEVSERWSKL